MCYCIPLSFYCNVTYSFLWSKQKKKQWVENLREMKSITNPWPSSKITKNRNKNFKKDCSSYVLVAIWLRQVKQLWKRESLYGKDSANRWAMEQKYCSRHVRTNFLKFCFIIIKVKMTNKNMCCLSNFVNWDF